MARPTNASKAAALALKNAPKVNLEVTVNGAKVNNECKQVTQAQGEAILLGKRLALGTKAHDFTGTSLSYQTGYGLKTYTLK